MRAFILSTNIQWGPTMLVKHDYLEIKLLKAGKKILKNEKENNRRKTHKNECKGKFYHHCLQ